MVLHQSITLPLYLYLYKDNISTVFKSQIFLKTTARKCTKNCLEKNVFCSLKGKGEKSDARSFKNVSLCSREVYHTKRMQHVITVKWTSDNKYILCGSDEMNIRLWKANASEKLGVVRVAFCFFNSHKMFGGFCYY